MRLPDALLRDAQRRAAQTGRTFTQFLADCLRAELRQPLRAHSVAEPLPTYKGEGLRPGADLSDSSALEDLMTER